MKSTFSAKYAGRHGEVKAKKSRTREVNTKILLRAPVSSLATGYPGMLQLQYLVPHSKTLLRAYNEPTLAQNRGGGEKIARGKQ